jgi:hypothetical protein
VARERRALDLSDTPQSLHSGKRNSAKAIVVASSTIDRFTPLPIFHPNAFARASHRLPIVADATLRWLTRFICGHTRIPIVIFHVSKSLEALSIRTQLARLMQIDDGGCFGHIRRAALAQKFS